MKKMKIKNKMYNVTSLEDYYENKQIYNNKYTAIEVKGNVLPVKGKSDKDPGIYPNDTYAYIKLPSEEDLEEYSAKNIIDYSKAKNIEDIINKDNLVRDIENELLETKDNIFQLNIGSEDTPEMVAIKQAINSKQVDIKQYEDRFEQFQNDIRLLKGKSITLGKLISTCENFDISAELTLKDKEACANPMNKEIHIDLTERSNE